MANASGNDWSPNDPWWNAHGDGHGNGWSADSQYNNEAQWRNDDWATWSTRTKTSDLMSVSPKANAIDTVAVFVEEKVADTMVSKVDALEAKIDEMAEKVDALTRTVSVIAARLDTFVARRPESSPVPSSSACSTPPPPAGHARRCLLPEPPRAFLERTPSPLAELSIGAKVMAGHAMAPNPSGNGDPEHCIAQGLHGPSAGPENTLLNRMRAVNGTKWVEAFSVHQWGSHASASVLFGWDNFADAVYKKMITHFSDFEFEAATQNKSNRFLKVQCRHCNSWTMVNYWKGTVGEEARSQVVVPLAKFLRLEDAANADNNDSV